MSWSLTTDRVRLDPLVVDDASAFFAYRRLPEVARYQGRAFENLDAVVDFIEGLPSSPVGSPGPWHQLAIRLRETGELVGDVGLGIAPPASPDQRGLQAGIGFTLAPAAQGGGLATEAVRAVIGWCFGEAGVHRLTASVDPRNTSSLRLCARVGMRREAEHLRAHWHRGEWVDDVVFALLAEECSAL